MNLKGRYGVAEKEIGTFKNKVTSKLSLLNEYKICIHVFLNSWDKIVAVLVYPSDPSVLLQISDLHD